MKKIHYWILIVIPLFYFTIGAYFNQVVGHYSVRSADPEYIFFINGLSIANGKFKIGNIDHPAIPFDYLVATSLRITHFFRQDNASFTEDVLANSDRYLKVVNMMMIIVSGIMIYLTGFLAIKINPNIWYAIIIQFSPFTTEIVYGNIGRLTTESLLPIPVMLLTLIILKVLTDPGEKPSRRDILIIAVVSAFGISMKLTFLPILLIPAFIIKSGKNIIFFGIAVVIIFLVIAIPVTLQLNYFINWTKSLFLYSGQYGHGEKNIVNLNEVIPNIVDLYRANRFFFIFTFLFIISFILTIPILRKNPEGRKWLRAGLALILVLIIQVLALSKHFKTHYFIVTLMLFPLLVILTLEFAGNQIPKRIMKSITPIYILLIISMFIGSQFKTVRGLSVHFEEQNDRLMKSYHFLKTIEKECIKIIVPGFYGGPSEEYALMTSYQWAGKYKSIYKPLLRKLYPDSYIFYPWDKTINFWGDSINLTNSSKSTYIYINKLKQKEEFKSDLKSFIPDSLVWEMVFFNEPTEEAVFRIKSQGEKSNGE